MKSAILVKSRKPLVIDNIELPKELSFGQVLVNIKFSGICGSQINEIDAVKGRDRYLSFIRTRGSGVVEKIGRCYGLKSHVVLHWRKFWYRCRACKV